MSPVQRLSVRWRRLTRSLRGRRLLMALLAVSAAAFALRLAVCIELADIPSVQAPWKGTDMATYQRLARDIARGNWPDRFYYQPLYYAIFLPLVYWLPGPDLWGVLLVQALLGAATVLLTGLTAARLFGRRAGLVAAIGLALYRVHVFYTPFHLIATLQAFWMILLLYLCLSAWRRSSPPLTKEDLAPVALHWGAVALVAAAAILTRGNALLLLPPILLFMVWRLRPLTAGPEGTRRCVMLAVAVFAFLVLCYLPQLPFALRNLHHYGRWTGPSSAQDAVLALGNNPEAPPGGLEYPLSYREWMRRASLPADERQPVSRQMLAFATAHPLVYAELKFRAFLLFWHRLEVPNNVAMANEGRHSLLLQLPPPLLLDFGLVGTLALYGLFTRFRPRSPRHLLLASIVLVYCLGTVLFYILARFRLPVVPVLCVCAAGGLDRLLCLPQHHTGTGAAVPAGRRQRLLTHALAGAVAVFVVFGGFTWYQNTLEPRIMTALRPGGISVQTPDRCLVHDHGPFVIGGLRFIDVPESGLHITKRFEPDPHVLECLAHHPVHLRLPLQLAQGTRFRMRVSHNGRSYTAPEPTFEKGPGFQWAVLDLTDLRPERGQVTVETALLPIAGQVLVGVDILRDYGRTDIRLRSGETVLDSAEAAFELACILEDDAN